MTSDFVLPYHFLISLLIYIFAEPDAGATEQGHFFPEAGLDRVSSSYVRYPSLGLCILICESLACVDLWWLILSPDTL